MTGILNMLVASAPEGFQPFTFALQEAKAGTSASSAIYFTSEGLIGIIGNQSNCSSPNWYFPTTTGIESSYWCKLVVKTGTNPTGSAVNTIISCSGNPQWNWIMASVGMMTATVTVTFYKDAGGTQPIYTTPDSQVIVQRTS